MYLLPKATVYYDRSIYLFPYGKLQFFTHFTLPVFFYLTKPAWYQHCSALYVTGCLLLVYFLAVQAA